VIRPDERGSASVWAVLIVSGAFTVLLGLVVDGGRVVDDRAEASRVAAQAARAGADALSAASVRNGGDALAADAAAARAKSYLSDAGMTGTVRVRSHTVTVTVTGRSATEILSIIGVTSFAIDETRSATAITEEATP
jgi:Flp pilus assembly protein TadG